jgi:hypothetical protein
MLIESVVVRFLPGFDGLVVQGLSLVDERTGAFIATTQSADGKLRLAHSGDVKIYEDSLARPRAYLVCQPFTTTDDEEAYAWLATHPDGVALFTDVPFAAVAPCDTSAPGQAQIISYTPERIVIRASTDSDAAYLVLADAWYPGWTATDDDSPAKVYRANGVFRAVQIPQGEHEIVFTYQSLPFKRGTVISLASLIAAAGLLFILPNHLHSGSPSRP